MAETIFSRIIRGEVPCHKIYEDAHVLAFLDIQPLSPGHTLVIPKEEVATVDQLSDDAAAAVGRVLPRISRAVLAATGAREFNILQNNGASAHQAVFHVHFHIIPKLPDGRGLELGWKPEALDATSATALAARISSQL
jgi:histidine triad (HIT) family protein